MLKEKMLLRNVCSTIILLVLLSMMLFVFSLPFATAEMVVDVMTDKGGQGFGNMEGGVYRGLKDPFTEPVKIEVVLSSPVDKLTVTIIKPNNKVQKIDERYSVPHGKYTYTIAPDMPGVWKVGAEIVKKDANLYFDDMVSFTVVDCSDGFYTDLTLNIDDISITVNVLLDPFKYDVFIKYCYLDQFRQYYHLSYSLNEVAIPALNIREVRKIEREYKDDNLKKLVTSLIVPLDKVGGYDPRSGALTIIDPIKEKKEETYFLRRVCIQSINEITEAHPTEYLRRDAPNKICWENTNKISAPPNYSIRISKYTMVKMNILGLPKDVRTSVIINGLKIGEYSSGELEYNISSKVITISTEPSEIQIAQDVRYRCLNCPIIINATSDEIYVNIEFVKEFLVRVDSEPRVAGLYVNEKELSPSELPYSIWVEDGGAIKLEAPTIIPLKELEREREVWRFHGWEPLSNQPSISINVRSPIQFTAKYTQTKQFKIVIETPYSSVTASCGESVTGQKVELWCDEKSRLEVSLISKTVDISDGVKMEFDKWSNGNRLPVITLDIVGSIELKADWRPLYRMSIKVEPSTQGVKIKIDEENVTAPIELWLPQGKHALKVVDKTFFDKISDDTQFRLVFTGWSDRDSQIEKIVELSSPLDLTVIYTQIKQFKVKINSSYGKFTISCNGLANEGKEAWCDEGSNLSVKPILEKSEQYKYVSLSENVRAVFVGWKNYPSGEETLTSVLGSPLTLEPNWKIMYYIQLVDQYGLTNGGGWYFEGERVEISGSGKTSQGLIDYVFDGLKVEDGAIISKNLPYSFIADKPLKLIVLYRPDYTILILLISALLGGGSSGGLALFLIRGRAKIRPIDYVKYRVCSNCNSVPPQDFKGDTCPNCNHKIVTKLIPAKCPKCYNELGTIAFPPPPEIRCRECGYIIPINKEH
jgi:DNA-directed RNA polymerase subunit RPC12/RpoP